MFNILARTGEAAVIPFGIVFPAIALFYQYVWRPIVLLRPLRARGGISIGRSRS
jgi:hypothetical protein